MMFSRRTTRRREGHGVTRSECVAAQHDLMMSSCELLGDVPIGTVPEDFD